MGVPSFETYLQLVFLLAQPGLQCEWWPTRSDDDAIRTELGLTVPFTDIRPNV